MAMSIDMLYGRENSQGSSPPYKELQQLKSSEIGKINHSKWEVP